MRAIPSAKKRECIGLRVEKNLSTPAIARLVGISNFSAYKILVKHPWRPYKNGRNVWAASANNKLRLIYPNVSWDELRAAFPNRTDAAIQKQANALGVKRDSKLHRKNKHYVSPVAEALRAERLRRRLTGSQVADKMGYHVVQLRAWELGINTPNLRQLEDWCAALGMTLVVHMAQIEAVEAAIAPIDKARLMAGR